MGCAGIRAQGSAGSTRTSRPVSVTPNPLPVTQPPQLHLSPSLFFLSLSATALVATAPLRTRTSTPLSLTSTLGKSTLVTSTTPLSQRGGFYCDVCLCLLKDSQTYLDHINGRKHQKKLGMTMKVERVGVEGVKDRLEELKEKRGVEVRGKRKKREEDEGEEEEDGEEEQEGETVKEKVIAAELAKTAEEAEEEALMAQMGFKFKGFAEGKGS